MLTPHMHFPAEFKTGHGYHAEVLGWSGDRFVGLVSSDPHDPKFRYPEQWNSDGKAITCRGELQSEIWFDSNQDLIDPMAEHDQAYAQLDSGKRQACEFIWKAASDQGKKIMGIKALRAVSGAGLVCAKRWYEQTIPEAIAQNDQAHTNWVVGYP